MNIFILSDSTNYQEHISLQAQYHCDRHVVKMIAESTQMIVTALQPAHRFYAINGLDLGNLPCKPLSAGHANHPCALWTRESFSHFQYLVDLATELCYEHQARYPLSPRHQYMAWLESVAAQLDEMFAFSKREVPSHFAVAIADMPTLRSTGTPHQEAVGLYRSYYWRQKRFFATWKRRGIPTWFLREQELAQDS